MKQLLVIGSGGYGQFVAKASAGLNVAVNQIDGRDVPNFATHQATHVVIATPNDTHYSIAKQAIEAGKHVLCEKPLALTRDEIDELYRLAGGRGVKLLVGFVLHRHPFYRYLRQLAQHGCVEALIINNNATEGTITTDWYWDRARSGGWFMVAEIHWYHLAAWLSGATEFRVKSAGEVAVNGRDVATHSIIDFSPIPRVVVDHRLDATLETFTCVVDVVIDGAHYLTDDWVPHTLAFPTPAAAKTGFEVMTRAVESETESPAGLSLSGAVITDTRPRDDRYQAMIRDNLQILLEDDKVEDSPAPVLVAHAVALAAQRQADSDE